jgi:hypothetical protein
MRNRLVPRLASALFVLDLFVIFTVARVFNALQSSFNWPNRHVCALKNDRSLGYFNRFFDNDFTEEAGAVRLDGMSSVGKMRPLTHLFEGLSL